MYHFNSGDSHANHIVVYCVVRIYRVLQQDAHAVQFARNVVISFASFMAAVFGHYRQYLKPYSGTDSNDNTRLATFDVDGFIELRDEGVTGASIGDVYATRDFLRDFRSSQMFEQFCRNRETLDIRSCGLEGSIFETLVQQSALRVGDANAVLSHQSKQTRLKTTEAAAKGELTVVDSDSSGSFLQAASGSGDLQQIEQDDQLSAAELRAKSAAATDLFLASELVSFYRVDSRAMIRSESARDSEEVGILEEGEIIKVSNLADRRTIL